MNILSKVLKNKSQLLFLIGISSLCYFLSTLLLDKSIDSKFMFDGFNSNADSYSYLQVGLWILGDSYSEHIAYRPFLFPLIIGLLYKTGGVVSIWLFNFICYTLAHYLLHISIKKTTKSSLLSWTGSALFLINFSLVGITFHALTETLVVFGITVLIYLTSLKTNNSISSSKYWGYTIALIGILTVIKPVFFIPFCFLLILFTCLLIFKVIQWKNVPKLSLGIALLFIIMQIVIIKVNYNEYNVSLIAKKTVKNYLISQCIMDTHHVARADAKKIASEMNSEDLLSYISNNKAVISNHFSENLLHNIKAYSFIEDFNNTSNNALPAYIMRKYNHLSLYIIILILITGLLYILYKIKTKILPFLFIFTLLFYFLFVTGISFDQRDRLVLGVLPLWIFLFVFIVNSQTLLKLKKS